MINVGKGFGRYRNRSVVVSSDGLIVRGVLERSDGRVVVVRDCQAVNSQLGTSPVDGKIVFPIHKIQYVQVK